MLIRSHNGQRDLAPSTVTRRLPNAEKAARTGRKSKPLHTLRTPAAPKVKP